MRWKKENIKKFLATCKTNKNKFERKIRNGDEVDQARISTVKITSDLIIRFPKLGIKENTPTFNSLIDVCIKAVKKIIKTDEIKKDLYIEKPKFLNYGDNNLFRFLLSFKRNELLDYKSKEKRDECIKWDSKTKSIGLIKRFEEKPEPRNAIDLIENMHSFEPIYKFEKMSEKELKEKFQIRDEIEWNHFLSECHGKNVYENSQKAKHAAGNYEMVHHEKMNNYKCSFCNMFHIGHDSSQNENQNKKWKIKRRKS